MGIVFGPSKSHSSYLNTYVNSATALGSTVCGGRLFCKSLGIAWIVAPAATQVVATWNGSSGSIVGNKPWLVFLLYVLYVNLLKKAFL